MQKIITPKKKLQPIKYVDVEDLMCHLEGDILLITQRLRALIKDTFPELLEKLSYNVPFYSRRRMVAFIWPGTVLWGQKGFEGVRLGYSRGDLLWDENSILDGDGRKFVKYLHFMHPKDIVERTILDFLSQAVEIDEEIYIQKKKKH